MPVSLKPVVAKLIKSCDRNALGIFSFLFIFYLLTFNGQFTSIDEFNLYAMVESLVQTKSIAVPQVSFAAYHNPVGAHEIGYPLLATPLYWLAVHTPAVNNIYMVMMLNPFLVALTSAFIYLCARRLGYSVTGSTLAALAYGLGSLGWPYAQSFYREPLVGFLWVAGFYGLISWRTTGAKWRGGLGLVLILLSPLAKINVVFSVPFLFLVARETKSTWSKRTYLILGAIGVSLLAAFPLLYQWRIGVWWDYAAIAASLDPVQILTHTYGQLISPVKGLIFYMPISLLVVPGLYLLWRKHPYVAWGIGLAFLSLLGATSAYGAWYGGQSWGPRLLLPVIPVVLIPLASLWDRIQLRFVRSFVLGLLALSAIMQATVVTNNWWKGYTPFLKMASIPENSVGLSYRYLALSPPWVALRNWRASDLDLLWLQTDYDGKWQIQTEIGVLLCACLLSVFIIGKARVSEKFGVLVLAPVLPAIVILQLAGANVSIGYPGMTKATAQSIGKWAQPDGWTPYTLVTMSNEFHIYFFEGWLKGDFIHYWYSPGQTSHFDTILENTKGQWLSFAADRVHIQPTDTGKELEGWLNERLYRFGHEGVGGFDLVHFAILPPDNWTWKPLQLEIGPFRFAQIGVNTTRLFPQDVLGIQLQVCKSAEVSDPHTLFLHLLTDGAIVEGLDGPIQYGGMDVNSWKTGECLIERRGIYIPPDTKAGIYDLILGVYTPAGRIATTDEAGQAVTYRNLEKITILEPGSR
jgi:hypothetical protein